MGVTFQPYNLPAYCRGGLIHKMSHYAAWERWHPCRRERVASRRSADRKRAPKDAGAPRREEHTDTPSGTCYRSPEGYTRADESLAPISCTAGQPFQLALCATPG